MFFKIPRLLNLIYTFLIYNKHLKYKIGIISFIFFIYIYFLSQIPNPLFKNNYSTIITDKDGKILRVFLNDDQQWIFPPDYSEKIPEKLKISVLNFEDKRFYSHFGIDFFALSRAIWLDVSHFKKISGASTITMQVSRLIRSKKRNLYNKFKEMCQAVNIEINYSKDEVLKFYLNHAPYGSNIIGYKTAVMKYFGKKADKLTWAESAFLAVLPNAPSTINPVSNNNKLKNKRNKLLKTLFQKEIIDKETYQLALMEKIPNKFIPSPFYIPHLSRELHKTHKNKIVKTTIIKKHQKNINAICKTYANFLHQKGIENLAVVVSETKSAKIRAYIGSDNYFGKNEGQVDGAIAPRSTGSILKPFLYALCLDKGMITTESILPDISLYYGSFTPKNANNTFMGIVRASTALIHSLNTVAVNLLYRYGIDEFYAFLIKAKMTTLFRSSSGYGLPLIIGGAEGKLTELTAMFNGLGNLGRFRKLQVIENPDSLKESKQLISSGAAYLILNILKDLKRPGVEYYWNQFDSSYPLAWKTGTSYGNRDAWAIGVSPKWTIGVWVGNFDGAGNPNIIGSKVAGPLLFDVFNYLPKDDDISWFPKPFNALKSIKVTKDSGYLPIDECQETTNCLVPINTNFIKKSPFHKSFFTNKKGTYRVCSLCWDENDKIKTTQMVLPPEIIKYLSKAKRKQYLLPPHKKGCPGISDNRSLKITYPTNNSYILIPKNFSGQYQKVKLLAGSNRKKAQIFWYVDDIFLGKTKNEHTLSTTFETGKHILTIIDDYGNKDKIVFTVQSTNKITRE